MKTILCALALALAACGGHDLGSIDTTIGAGCSSDRNCDNRCFLDNNDNFPGGFCSLPCLSDRDCPGDTYCVDHQGGVCMFICPAFNCALLGPGWACKDVDHLGGGKVNVCSG